MSDVRETYMRAALSEAAAAREDGEVPVGAVLVRGGEIIARAHNACRAESDPTAHAELLCLKCGLSLLGGRLQGCTLYVTLEPCAMCAGACVNAKLPELVFGAYDAQAGCCGSKLDVCDHALLWSVRTWGGILEAECAGLLTSFFEERRTGCDSTDG